MSNDEDQRLNSSKKKKSKSRHDEMSDDEDERLNPSKKKKSNPGTMR